ncbi:fumarylacetoacetate hydrolase family protein [Amylibacter sp.]|jgi:2-keto-4-pentenoate hydratase/2-oxohepta-3-ene-1,7-dioic acid hydratase in catechol pathway|nr:fumarylacetoacetate hydrolase family protein [Amylibacter sp.]
MRFATYSADDQTFYGAVTDGGMIALSDHFPQWPTLREVIADDGLDTLDAAANGKAVTHASGSFVFEIPIPRPEKIICVGVNFPERNAEYKDGKEAPKFMSLFPRFARSFVGHDVPLTRPKASVQLDYEGEVVVVIGKGGRHIKQEDALDHIAALSICNEGTIRDWVRHAKFNVTQGKNWDGSGAIGPWIVPFKDPSQLLDIKLETRVNGEVRQSDRSSRMIFSHADEIAYISTFTTLVPGDMIITGTPTGAGARFDPPIFLKPGDVVEVEVEGVGVLRNGVVDE